MSKALTRIGLICAGLVTSCVVCNAYDPFMKNEGAGWYTEFHGGMEAGGYTTLHRRNAAGLPQEVAEFVSVLHTYPPDCIVYRKKQGPYSVQCDTHGSDVLVPSEPEYYDQKKRWGHWAADSTGMWRREAPRLVNGSVVANVERITADEIRRTGNSLGAHAVQTTESDEPVRPNEPDEYGYPPLIDAVMLGDSAVVGALIDAGARVNAIAPHGITALVLAVGGFDTSTTIARLLVARGANPCLRPDGRTLEQNTMKGPRQLFARDATRDCGF